MKKLFFALIATMTISAASLAQTGGTTKTEPTPAPAKPAAESKKPSAADLAKLSIEFHGGDKFKGYKTLIIRGSADTSVSFGGQTQTLAGGFITTFSGDKYRLELTTPIRNFSQTYDGVTTTSSERAITLPPINRLGLPLLQRLGENGFVVSELSAELQKKKSGYRVTSPDGDYTDFFVDDKTGEIKGYESSFEVNGQSAATSVEIDKLRDVEGVKIPEKYAQRFDLAIGPIYVFFKAKDIVINRPIDDGVFKTAEK